MMYWFVGGAAALAILSIVLWHPVPLMLAFFLGIVGIAERQAGPNLVTAVLAYDTGNPATGEVTIWITCWDIDNHYHALVHEVGQPEWEYEFIPQGWQPVEGSYTARIWRNGSGQPPVLVTSKDGILIPRGNPKPPKEVRRDD
jgi:hypothetical protein